MVQPAMATGSLSSSEELEELFNDGFYETPRNIYAKSKFWDDSLEQLGGYDGILQIMKKNCKKVGIPIK